MAKRYKGSSRSQEKKARVKEDKFLQKYGYSADQEQFFQNYKRRREQLGTNLEEYDDLFWDWGELDFYYSDDEY